MQDVPLPWLAGILVLLVALSAFFSSTETALMSINRYRLRHRAREGSTGARAAEQLLERPDRLIGLILICNNFVNSAAAAIVTIICLTLGDEGFAAIGVGVLGSKMLEGSARQPELTSMLQAKFFVVMSVVDVIPIIGLALGLYLIFGVAPAA